MIATKDKRSIDTIPDVNQILEEAASAWAETLKSDFLVRAGDMNKFAVLAISKGDAMYLMGTICRVITGEYLPG